MADNDTPQEDKTEEPTAKRLREAREEGQVPRSKELASAVVMLSCTGLLLALSGPLGGGLMHVLHDAFSFDLRAVADAGGLAARFGSIAASVLLLASPLIALAVLAAIVGTLGVGGLNLAPKALQPKFSRIDPLAGLKRLYSLPSVIETGKSLFRIAIVMSVAAIVLVANFDRILGLNAEPDRAGILHGLSLVGWTILALSAALGLIALIDAPLQWWKHHRQLRMTLQEVRREMKETEGNPEIKGRVRQLQREMSRRRMMEAVPTADVVLMNPTHYAVALKYEQGRMRAPRVVAKGQDLIAFAIRDLAQKHKVPIVTAAPLARALYRSAEIGQEIPAQLYQAVATVLSFVYQLKVYRRHGGREPVLGEVQIDESKT